MPTFAEVVSLLLCLGVSFWGFLMSLDNAITDILKERKVKREKEREENQEQER